MYSSNRTNYLNTQIDLNNSVQFIKQFCGNCKDYKLGPVSFSICNECSEENQPIDDCYLQNEANDNNEIKLMEIAAKVVALNYPFQSIEERYERIPEPVQRRIIYWSFAQYERDIYMYSSLTPDEKSHKTIFDKFSVSNVLQVGFHLSGTVTPNPKQTHYYQQNELEKKYRVSICFDRCKITSVTCSCDLRDIFWCQHVVALAIYRIRYPRQVKLRVKTLLQLDKCQLQKLVQFLISEHHTEVLPTAQSLADKILNRNSILNAIRGAPDPTAGAAIEQENCWHLDEQQVTKQVTHILNENCQQINKQMNALFGKVKEMLKARDSNASRMLRLITEQFLIDRRLVSYRSQGTISDRLRQLWDQLVSLWVYIALNPHANLNERKKISDLLISWTQNPNCPLEDSNSRSGSSLKRKLASNNQISDDDDDNNRSDDDMQVLDEDVQIINDLFDNNNNYNFNNDRKRQSNSKNKHKRKRHTPRTIFHRALEASYLKWDDPHLKFILCEEFNSNSNDAPTASTSSPSSSSPSSSSSSSNYHNVQSTSNLFNSQGFPLWNESLPIACARVEALRCHGYQSSALKLAVSIVRSMKKQQIDSINLNRNQNAYLLNSILNNHNSEGWIGNQLDSISILFDTLAEASLISDAKSLEQFYGAYPGDLINNNHQNVAMIEQTPFFHDDALHAIINGTTHNNKPQYNLSMTVSDSQDRNETYISLALEAALIGLGQQRLMPSGEYLQEKTLKQEERLIAKLNDIQFNQHLIRVLCNQVRLLLEGGPLSGFGKPGLRAMRLPILQGINNNNDNFVEDLNNNLPNNNRYAFPHHLNYPNLNHQFNPYFNPLINNHIHPNLNYQQPQQQNNHHHHHHHQHNRSHHYNRNSSNNNNNSNSNNWHRWHVMHIIEQQQCLLATTMIYAARNDYIRLKLVQKAALKHIHTSNYLFKLAQDAFRIAIPNDSNTTVNNTNSNTGASLINNFNTNHHNHHTHQLNYLRSLNSSVLHQYNFPTLALPPNLAASLGAANLSKSTTNHHSTAALHLLEVAYELGLQVVKMTMPNSDSKRKEIVKWIVTCSTEIGFNALHNLMTYWSSLFSPIEAVIPVAGIIMNQTVLAKLNLTAREYEQLAIAARQLAVDCAKKDPSNCGLPSLNLCEGDHLSYEKCYRLIEEAGKKSKMNFQQLMNVAKHIEQRNNPKWAYRLCQLAIRSAKIGINFEQSPLVADIHYAVNLAGQIGKEELSNLVPILIENIECAQVLSDLLRSCASKFGCTLAQTNTANQQQHQQNHHQTHTNQLNGYQYFNNTLANPLTGLNFQNHHNHHHRRQSSHHHHNLNKQQIDLKDPLKSLLDASIAAYVNATHSRLSSISPRHYTDFVDFLDKARETFILAADGENKFNALIDNIKQNYKGKKKLMTTIRSKFG